MERIVAFLTQSMVWTRAIKGEFARLAYDTLLQANHLEGCVCRGLQRLCKQGQLMAQGAPKTNTVWKAK